MCRLKLLFVYLKSGDSRIHSSCYSIVHDVRLDLFRGMRTEHLTPGAVNDLFRFDPAVRQWTEIAGLGAPPSARMAVGFAAAGGQLYVFGGAFPTTQSRPGPPGQSSQLRILNYSCESNKMIALYEKLLTCARPCTPVCLYS